MLAEISKRTADLPAEALQKRQRGPNLRSSRASSS
jgi:hypothetical protein